MAVQDSADAGDAQVGVLLEPFLHRWGALIVTEYDEDTVCKPSSPGSRSSTNPCRWP